MLTDIIRNVRTELKISVAERNRLFAALDEAKKIRFVADESQGHFAPEMKIFVDGRLMKPLGPQKVTDEFVSLVSDEWNEEEAQNNWACYRHERLNTTLVLAYMASTGKAEKVTFFRRARQGHWFPVRGCLSKAKDRAHCARINSLYEEVAEAYKN